MRIGVISDTHDHLRNVVQIVALLNAAKVERVIHTGDITRPRTLLALAELRAPVFGVFGNNDVDREGLGEAAAASGCVLAAAPLELAWAGRRIVVVHDPRDLEDIGLEPGAVAVHGHNHRLVIERRGAALVFNPGECAGHLRGHNAVGLIDLLSLRPELLHF